MGVRRGALIAVAVLLGGVGCGGGGGDSADDEPVPDVRAETPSSLPAASTGEGLLVIDGVHYEFAVTKCTDATADDLEVGTPRTLFSLEGTGTGPGEEPFTVTVSRVLVKTQVQTFTDRVDFLQSGLDFHLVAERAETNGQVIDLRDPMATRALLKLGDGHVSGNGTFGRSGGTDQDRTLPGTMDAACP